MSAPGAPPPAARGALPNGDATHGARPPPDPSAPASRREAAKVATLHAVDDVERLANAYLSRLEGALTHYYDEESAAQDFAVLMGAITNVENVFAGQNTLHVSSANIGKDVAQVTQDALRAKDAADADYQKTADAAAVASARFSAGAADAAGT